MQNSLQKKNSTQLRMVDQIMQAIEQQAVYVKETDQLMLDVSKIKAILREYINNESNEYKEYMNSLKQQLVELQTTLTTLSK